MNKDIPTHSGRSFTWNGKRGFSEASTLQARCKSSFADLRCKGFNIKSNKTGKTKLFTLMGTSYDDDGDIRSWSYMTEDCTVEVVIFND